MLQVLITADETVLGLTSRAVAAACRATGKTLPFFMAVWRFLFFLLVFLTGIAVVAFEASVFSIALLAVEVYFLEMFRKATVPLWRDSRKEWDSAMFRRYAAVALVKRKELFGMRLLMAFHGTLLAAGTVVAFVVGASDMLRVALAYNLYIVFLICAGGWMEASDPPPPYDGDRFILACPSAA